MSLTSPLIDQAITLIEQLVERNDDLLRTWLRIDRLIEINPKHT
jgi:hypothetical protein